MKLYDIALNVFNVDIIYMRESKEGLHAHDIQPLARI